MDVYFLIVHLQYTPKKRKVSVGGKKAKVHGKTSTVAAKLGIASQVVFLLFFVFLSSQSVLEIVVPQSAKEDRIVVSATERETPLRIGRVSLEKDGKWTKKSRFSFNRKKRSGVEKLDAENISHCAPIICKEAETEFIMIKIEESHL